MQASIATVLFTPTCVGVPNEDLTTERARRFGE